MNAKEIAEALEETASLLELQGENPFKVRAYTNSAEVLRHLSGELSDFVAEIRAGKVKGIGTQLSDSIEKLYERGHLPLLEELRAQYPATLMELFQISGLGPKKIKLLYEKLQVKSIADLEAACKSKAVLELKGFSDKTAQKILDGIASYRSYSAKFIQSHSLEHAELLTSALLETKLAERIELTGELRRCLPIIESIDLIAATDDSKSLFDAFEKTRGVSEIILREGDSISARLFSGLPVNLRAVVPQKFEAALFGSTGSGEFNEQLSQLAAKNGYSFDADGLTKKDSFVTTEAEAFATLGLAEVPPECREQRSDIEYAAKLASEKKKFPEAVRLADLKGILHAHSTYSDGKNSLREMAEAVRDREYQYFGISDHSQSAVYAGGLSVARIHEQIAEIDRLNAALAPFKIFKGIEADILHDGKLDYPDEVLALFDFVIVSIHSRFSMPEAEMTKRIITALAHPLTTILAHPTGRLLLQREGYQVDIPQVLAAAAEYGVAVEINANPRRLDLDWTHLELATKLGIQIPISPDAHSIAGIDGVKYGVNVARKGRLAKESVLNCLTAAEIGEHFAKRRAKARVAR